MRGAVIARAAPHSIGGVSQDALGLGHALILAFDFVQQLLWNEPIDQAAAAAHANFEFRVYRLPKSPAKRKQPCDHDFPRVPLVGAAVSTVLEPHGGLLPERAWTDMPASLFTLRRSNR